MNTFLQNVSNWGPIKGVNIYWVITLLPLKRRDSTSQCPSLPKNPLRIVCTYTLFRSKQHLFWMYILHKYIINYLCITYTSSQLP